MGRLCDNKFDYKDPSHRNYTKPFHVLICQHNCQDQDNLDLFEQCRRNELSHANYLLNVMWSYVKVFKTNVKRNNPSKCKDDKEIKEDSLFLLELIEVNGKQFRLFFHTGCGATCIHKKADDNIGDCTVQVSMNTVNISSFGKSSTTTEQGMFKLSMARTQS